MRSPLSGGGYGLHMGPPREAWRRLHSRLSSRRGRAVRLMQTTAIGPSAGPPAPGPPHRKPYMVSFTRRVSKLNLFIFISTYKYFRKNCMPCWVTSYKLERSERGHGPPCDCHDVPSRHPTGWNAYVYACILLRSLPMGRGHCQWQPIEGRGPMEARYPWGSHYMHACPRARHFLLKLIYAFDNLRREARYR